MLKYSEIKVDLYVIPDEITLAINITNCPYKCEGCHSPHLRDDIGIVLDEDILVQQILLNPGITCVCFMGGDANAKEVGFFAKTIKKEFPEIKTAMYSGNDAIPRDLHTHLFTLDYLKLGHYDSKLGGLDNPNTNQRLYKIAEGLENITHKFWRKQMKELEVKIKKLNENAVLPTKASEFAGGWDVVVTEIERKSADFVVCKLGFAAEFPNQYKMTLVPRSSITKTKWLMQNTPGLGDADYRGEYQCRFRALPVGFMAGQLIYDEFPFKVGDRIGQIYMEHVIPTNFIFADELDTTDRGEGGFGSTNNK